MKVGDVISMKGPTVPKALWGKFFRVEAVGETVTLSQPYDDEALTRRFYLIDPITRLPAPDQVSHTESE
jgi:hypothetical protein